MSLAMNFKLEEIVFVEVCGLMRGFAIPIPLFWFS